MKRLIYIILNLFLFTSFTGCNNNLSEKSSTNGLTITGNYDQSPVVLSKDFIEIYVGESATIEVESKYSVTYYIYDNDEDIVKIEYIEENKYNIIGLKKGSAEIYFLSLNGKSGDLFVNVY